MGKSAPTVWQEGTQAQQASWISDYFRDSNGHATIPSKQALSTLLNYRQEIDDLMTKTFHLHRNRSRGAKAVTLSAPLASFYAAAKGAWLHVKQAANNNDRASSPASSGAGGTPLQHTRADHAMPTTNARILANIYPESPQDFLDVCSFKGDSITFTGCGVFMAFCLEGDEKGHKIEAMAKTPNITQKIYMGDADPHKTFKAFASSPDTIFEIADQGKIMYIRLDDEGCITDCETADDSAKAANNASAVTASLPVAAPASTNAASANANPPAGGAASTEATAMDADMGTGDGNNNKPAKVDNGPKPGSGKAKGKAKAKNSFEPLLDDVM